MTTTHTPLENAVMMPRQRIRPSAQNARKFFHEEELSNLRESIRKHGILSPLLVRFNGTDYELTAGERRWWASEGVLNNLPVIIENVSEMEARERSLVENLQRRDLTAAEEAGAVREIMENEGLSIRQVADRLHKSTGWVTNRLSYLKTGADVRDVGSRVTKAMSSLLLVDKVKTPEVRGQLLREIEEYELPHAEVKNRVDAHLEAQEAKARAEQFIQKSQKAPDTQTQSRVAAADKGESAGMSRGQRVTGGPSRKEANQEVVRALGQLEAWVAHCDKETFEKAQILARRIVRGDLAR
ncbi:MAG: ParB/RepB/Spo0J family partition protein [Armatimonadetes bacterium]|nr:ParB/RepB/Spo0J family partition protein [Armatimonadota bacterium]